MFRYVILGLLRDGVALHGYGLMKEHHSRSGAWVNSGNFSRELRRLASEGLVFALAHPVGSDPSRIPYRITAAGVAAFDSWLASEIGHCNDRQADELSARILFIDEAGEAIIMSAMDAWRRQLWAQVKLLERSRLAASKRACEHPAERFAALPHLLARRLKHLAADLEFLEELRVAVREWWREQRGARASRRTVGRDRSEAYGAAAAVSGARG